jgi:hypothetical protein
VFTRAPLVLTVLIPLVTFSPAAAVAQPPLLVGLGDSIGEGVQSGDANASTQPWSVFNIVAWRMGAPFPLPLVRTSPLAGVSNTSGRTRIDPGVRSPNLAVSGADVHTLLHDPATAVTVSDIDRETELMLFPRLGSQIEVAEALRPRYVLCWIGNNDALGAALDFSHLNATQLTPVDTFTADFTQLVERLEATGTKAVFGTIPDITAIGYLLNRQELARFLGSAYGLPAGNLTTLSAMLMVRLGLSSSAIFADPDYSLDPAEQAAISGHIGLLNGVIRTTVAAHGMAIVDTHDIFDYFARNVVTLFGAPLTTRFLGGWFSLDGVHPSNIGQTVAAIYFIDALNRRYGAAIPQIDANTLFLVANSDPFIDKDRDGRVQGRSGAGLLETMLALLGISGDSNDGALSPTGATGVTPLPAAGVSAAGASAGRAAAAKTSPAPATAALDGYERLTGRDLRTMPASERIEAIRQLFAGRGERR